MTRIIDNEIEFVEDDKKKTIRELLDEFELNLKLTEEVLDLKFTNLDFPNYKVKYEEDVKKYVFEGDHHYLSICEKCTNIVIVYINNRAEAGGYNPKGELAMDF